MIQYPNRHVPRNTRQTQGISYGKRGMALEEQINQSNAYYLTKGLAVIHKKPTPIQIVKVDFPKRSAAKITEAYFRHASTTDYNGVYKGFYLDFEAKETRQKTAFPLTNFHEHQVKHMEQCLQQQGITFIILKFSSLNRVFLLKAQAFISFWRDKQKERKSMPLRYIEQHGIEVPIGINPPLDYLHIIDDMIKHNHKF